MTKSISYVELKKQIIKSIRMLLKDCQFIKDHKVNSFDFTRVRSLPFWIIIYISLRKSVKAMQNVINEVFQKVDMSPVTVSAYTQARAKLKHTAFQALNSEIITLFYSTQNELIQKFKKRRFFAVDGSKIILPDSKDIKEHFGEIQISQPSTKKSYSELFLINIVDVFNNTIIGSYTDQWDTYEVKIAERGISDLTTQNMLHQNDVFVFDRGYASYDFIEYLTNNKKDFVIRIPQSSFKDTKEMFEPNGSLDKTVTLLNPKNKKSPGIKVRFVQLTLQNGTVEVLATSLLDEFKPDDLQFLYHKRWECETSFSILKSRLDLENFTGKTAESVYQDLHSCILVSNLEILLTHDMNIISTDEQQNMYNDVYIDKKELKSNENDILCVNSHKGDQEWTEEVCKKQDLQEEKNDEKTKNKKKTLYRINKSVSIHTMKSYVFDLLLGDMDIDECLAKMIKLFEMNKVPKRPRHKTPRKKTPPRQSWNYQKRKRKRVF